MSRFQIVNEARHAEARLRGGAGHKAKAAGSVLCIEGETVSVPQIAERLGVGVSAVNRRLAKARALPGAVTWAGLGA